MKPCSNVVLLFKNSGTTMEDDQKFGNGWIYSCEIVSDTRCGLASTQVKVCAQSSRVPSPCVWVSTKFLVVVQGAYINVLYKMSAA